MYVSKVLILCEYPSLNGGERSLLAMVDQLPEARAILEVAAPARGPLAEAVRERGLPLTPLRLHDARGRRHAIAHCREQLKDLIQEAGPQVIHANSLSMSRLLGPVAEQLRVPSLGHLRDMIKLNPQAIRDLSANTRLLAVSQATQRWYARLGLDISSLQVLYNGVDLESFRPRPATGFLHRELGISPGIPLIASIGQVGMRKGVDLFVDAATAVAAKRPDVQFVFIGQRYSQKQEAVDYEREVRRRASSETLEGRFHWLGVRDNIQLLMNELSLLVHAARQEPLGRVLLEAAASGLPCIATNVGGTPEIFPHQADAGILIPPEDPHTMAKQVLRLLADDALRQRLSCNARGRIEARFNARDAALELLKQYEDAAGKGWA